MKENLLLNQKIKEVIEKIHPKPNEISFAVIDLKINEPQVVGYNADRLIYPASIYKVFVAAEILRQIDSGKRKLNDEIEIVSNDKIDGIRLFPKSARKDHRPLLEIGEKVTLDYLLDLMLTRSDNVASNLLLGIAGVENVNNNILFPNYWQETAVSSERLDQLKEKGDNRISSITVSSARHLAELFYKIETGTLVNPRVSHKLKEYMTMGTKDRKGGLFLPDFKSYYQKGGSLKINGYRYNFLKSLVRLILPKRYVITRYRGEAGVVQGKNSHYAIALLTQVKTKWPWRKVDMKKLSQKIYEIMENNE